MRALVLGLALVSTPVAAAEQQQFDLICSGDDQSWHYRVDLAVGEWCADVCDTVFKVASVTSGTIVLQSKEPQYRGGDKITNSINRATGDWYFYRSLPNIGFHKALNGKCEPQPFSGFPSSKVKF